MPSLPVPNQLADERVRLRPFVDRDAAAVFEACRDPLIRRFTTFPEVSDVSEVRAWIASQPGLRERGEALDLAITEPGNDVVVGAVGLGSVAFEHRRAAAGYWVAPAARGRGLAVAALGLLSTWALSAPLSLGRVELHIDVDNVGSRRTAERAGFANEGTMRSYLYAKGRPWDVAIYALVPR